MNIAKKKRIAMIALVGMVLLVMIIGTSMGQKTQKNEPNRKLVILMPYLNTDFLFESQKRDSGLENIVEYVHSFELAMEPDFEIEIRYIDTTDESTYISQRNSNLLGDDQPELFFISNWSDEGAFVKSYADELIKSGKALPIADKLKNYKYLFSGLDYEYYLPVGIDSLVPGYTDAVASEYGFKFNENEVTIDQEVTMLMDWFEKDKKYYDWMTDRIIFEGIINPIGMMSEDFMKVETPIDEIMDTVDRLKAVFEDEMMIVEQGMLYEELVDYYKRYANRYFRSGIEYGKMKNSYPMDFIRKANLTQPKHLAIEYYDGGSTYYRNNPRAIRSVGFMVNKDGGDLEAAYEFLDYLIRPAPQLSHYLYYGAYSGIVTTNAVPVVEAEEKIAHTSYQAMTQWKDFYKLIGTRKIPHITTEDVALINEFDQGVTDLIRRYLLMDDIKRTELKRKLYEMINTYEFRQVE
ncbi:MULTISPECIES: hypothetical protein [unclassified Fusibacter]|uniref:hypothetical protein n=1 Tax=unclassified Fusibacter TaxID=2624464 RepID=UPI0010105972|nr:MULTISPECIES: hypothetical protein [unclassified Fusibacter]MCK8061215.1 hypothetical protein [Fusibacter sp. A2]NPE23441.1 hypothetical protein [Fusibacter sp. A1]RXV59220.1 hypothetical protein DWB64_16620 [Fusibacter sp. A1]